MVDNAAPRLFTLTQPPRRNITELNGRCRCRHAIAPLDMSDIDFDELSNMVSRRWIEEQTYCVGKIEAILMSIGRQFIYALKFALSLLSIHLSICYYFSARLE